mgnify:CR=1 FL=1
MVPARNGLGCVISISTVIADAVVPLLAGWGAGPPVAASGILCGGHRGPRQLAAQNPGSAQAQRDLVVSYAKLAGLFPGQGWWAKAHEVCARLAADGRLAPADAWMLDVTAKQAAAEAGTT